MTYGTFVHQGCNFQAYNGFLEGSFSTKAGAIARKVGNIAFTIFVRMNPILLILHYAITSLTLPASRLSFSAGDDNSLNYPRIQRHHIAITGRDLQTLEGTARIHDTQKDLPFSEQKWIIYLGGNNEHAFGKNISDTPNRLSYRTEHNVLHLNYRGVSRFEFGPWFQEELYRDREDMVAFLQKQGVSPENITFYGYSLGGHIASHLALKNPQSKLVIDRSFSSITNVACSHIERKLGENICSSVIQGIVSVLLRLFSWDCNSEDILRQCNPQREVVILHDTNDEIILPKSRLCPRISYTLRSKEPAHFVGIDNRFFHGVHLYGDDLDYVSNYITR